MNRSLSIIILNHINLLPLLFDHNELNNVFYCSFSDNLVNAPAARHKFRRVNFTLYTGVRFVGKVANSSSLRKEACNNVKYWINKHGLYCS